jgi:hypothetical protein
MIWVPLQQPKPPYQNSYAKQPQLPFKPYLVKQLAKSP